MCVYSKNTLPHVLQKYLRAIEHVLKKDQNSNIIGMSIRIPVQLSVHKKVFQNAGCSSSINTGKSPLCLVVRAPMTRHRGKTSSHVVDPGSAARHHGTEEALPGKVTNHD